MVIAKASSLGLTRVDSTNSSINDAPVVACSAAAGAAWVSFTSSAIYRSPELLVDAEFGEQPLTDTVVLDRFLNALAEVGEIAQRPFERLER